MILFPFLIFATTLTSFLGTDAFVETTVRLTFDTWSNQIVASVVSKLVNVLTVHHTDLLTYGLLLAAILAHPMASRRCAPHSTMSIASLKPVPSGFGVRSTQNIFFVCTAMISFVVIYIILTIFILSNELNAAISCYLEASARIFG